MSKKRQVVGLFADLQFLGEALRPMMSDGMWDDLTACQVRGLAGAAGVGRGGEGGRAGSRRQTAGEGVCVWGGGEGPARKVTAPHVDLRRVVGWFGGPRVECEGPRKGEGGGQGRGGLGCTPHHLTPTRTPLSPPPPVCPPGLPTLRAC